MAGKTIGEHLAALKATRDAAQKKLSEVTQKSMDEGRSMDTGEREQVNTLQLEIKTLDTDIATFSAMESEQAKSAAPVNGDDQARAGASDSLRTGNLTLKHTENLAPGIGFARLARVKALAFTGQAGTRDEVQIAQALYPHDEKLARGLVQKAAVPAANTLSPTWAGNLINEGGIAFADFVEYLRPRSLHGQIFGRFRRLPFDTSVLVQGSAGTGHWTKEGDAKPMTSWTYTRAKLTPLKVTGLTAATKETLMRASVAADTFMRDELARAIGSRIDTTLISDAVAVTDESPAGLLAGTSALTLTGDGTIAGIRCDIAQFLKALVGNNLSVAGSFWVMPETVAIDLSQAVNEVGAPAFPGITPTGGTLAGLPVFTSQYVQVDSAGPVVALIKGDEIFLGDEGGIQVAVSDQATLVMDDAPSGNSITPTGHNYSGQQVVSMFQTNSIAILVERFLNWQKRRSQAVVWANVNWDACAS